METVDYEKATKTLALCCFQTYCVQYKQSDDNLIAIHT